jgi:hypothetical protein
VIEEGVTHVSDRGGARVSPRLTAGVQGVLLGQVLLEGAVGVSPRAEIVHLPPDLFTPVSGGMGGERVLGVGLGGLGRGRRMDLGHGDLLLVLEVTVAAADSFARVGHPVDGISCRNGCNCQQKGLKESSQVEQIRQLGEVPERPIGPVSKGYSRLSHLPAKTRENPRKYRVYALLSILPKRPEMCRKVPSR